MGIISLPPAVQVLLLPVIIFALSFHEYAHGWVAYKLGDPTAKNNGRLTLNPMAHLDPFGAMVLYFVGFGWAKPVPVDPRYLQNPRRDMMWIAFAGPVSNLSLAFLTGIVMNIFIYVIGYNAVIFQALQMNLYINIMLAIFNLIPVPPLDGSRILVGLLPMEYRDQIIKFEYYGPKVLFGIIIFGMLTGFNIIGLVISPFIQIFASLFTFGLI